MRADPESRNCHSNRSGCSWSMSVTGHPTGFGEQAMIKALLCDIDGTLVQSNWLHAEAWQAAFREIGLELEGEALRRQIGKGGDELIPVFVPWWRAKHVEEPLKAYRKFVFQADHLDKVKALPGAR